MNCKKTPTAVLCHSPRLNRLSVIINALITVLDCSLFRSNMFEAPKGRYVDGDLLSQADPEEVRFPVGPGWAS